jgi:hypothetical protein
MILSNSMIRRCVTENCLYNDRSQLNPFRNCISSFFNMYVFSRSVVGIWGEDRKFLTGREKVVPHP